MLIPSIFSDGSLYFILFFWNFKHEVIFVSHLQALPSLVYIIYLWLARQLARLSAWHFLTIPEPPKTQCFCRPQVR